MGHIEVIHSVVVILYVRICIFPSVRVFQEMTAHHIPVLFNRSRSQGYLIFIVLHFISCWLLLSSKCFIHLMEEGEHLSMKFILGEFFYSDCGDDCYDV